MAAIGPAAGSREGGATIVEAHLHVHHRAAADLGGDAGDVRMAEELGAGDVEDLRASSGAWTSAAAAARAHPARHVADLPEPAAVASFPVATACGRL